MSQDVASAGSWKGVFPALCTTFNSDGALDIEAQRAVVRFALASGAHGLVCFGLAGEVNKLTPGEREAVGTAIIEEAAGRVPVLVGVGAEATHTARRLARFFTDHGADGLVIAAPATTRLADRELYVHFSAVAGETDLPVVIQDAPEYLGVKISPEFVARLAAEHPHVRYVKVECGPEDTVPWVDSMGPDIGVFTGDAGLFLTETLRAGAVGSVPGVEVTDLLVEIYETEMRADRVAADQLLMKLLPYLRFSLQGIDHYNACAKEVLHRRGIIPRNGLRGPGPVLSDVASALLDGYLANLDLRPSRLSS
ncbi:dihydrodipicolinate synthase family protein [bacterium]|nr:MAG: dihydrodipicolinate synthase family protein [bacterium]